LGAYITSHFEGERPFIGLENKSEMERKQWGVECPPASEQPHLLIIRLNLSPQVKSVDDKPNLDVVRDGLMRLCGLFERIYKGDKLIDELKNGQLQPKHLVKDYKFSATLGFGIGFFDILNISKENRPRHILGMPDNNGLGDPTPYSLPQTDLIIQIASQVDHINGWVLENTVQSLNQDDDANLRDSRDYPDGELRPTERCCPDGQIVKKEEKCTPDIISAIEGWATIVDVHAGFQRLDGRNLMGFNDGVSNPRPHSGAPFNDVVWTTREDEGDILRDGTYMVYQKIEHDLHQWRQLSLEEQERWVGRKKNTGLLLGTLSHDEERKLSQNLQSTNFRIRQEAAIKLKVWLNKQKDPSTRFYDDNKYKNAVPAWSHVRKANPREELIDKSKGDVKGRIGKHLIFRRGYLFIENDENSDFRSGLQFICFQKNIKNGFEFIKKNWLNNQNFPVPISGPSLRRTFTERELVERHKHGRLTRRELIEIKYDMSKRKLLGLGADGDFNQALRQAGYDPTRRPGESVNDQIGNQLTANTQNTGREGLAGPSELGVSPTGQILAIIPMGGGYYFVPPIPAKGVKYIGQQFFAK
jgi:Dyp-type peroxidase family